MRILLSRLDRIGDLVLSTPALASVRRSWPRAHITLVCSSYNGAVVENTPDEILAVTTEMAERLEQRWQARAEDDDLQQRFLRILSDCGYEDSGPCRLGAAFLRENLALLQ